MSSTPTLAAADSCTIAVTFTPQSETSFGNRLHVVSNDVEDPEVTLIFTGTSEPPVVPPGGDGGGGGGCNTAGSPDGTPLLGELLRVMMLIGVLLLSRRRVKGIRDDLGAHSPPKE